MNLNPMAMVRLLCVLTPAHQRWLAHGWLVLLCLIPLDLPLSGQELVGVHVIPHQWSTEMRWRRAPRPDLAARVELFVQNRTSAPLVLGRDEPPRFDGKLPSELLAEEAWAWHDTPASWLEPRVELPPDQLAVLVFNGRSSEWGVSTRHSLQLGTADRLPFEIEEPQTTISAVTFLSRQPAESASLPLQPDRLVVHVDHRSQGTLQILGLRLWLPEPGRSHHVFRLAQEESKLRTFPEGGLIAGPGKAGFVLDCQPLPLGYGVVEVRVLLEGTTEKSLWAHLRIKNEVFDISGGWVASDLQGRNSLTFEDYLKTLTRMHINTGQIQEVEGYTNNPELYERFPLKRFNRLEPLDHYDSDGLLPQIHAVEFLGEPQYGGGRPVPPQEVWEKLAPYQPSRLATTVTLSEERNWRYYAGLSDYPHYDAYRVTAPAADSWTGYDRWGGERIRWGAPLETIGVMTRSLREQNRPRAIAYWSQGAHDGWGSRWSPRRGSPTPDELRSQAWHGLANRVTSLYWFNLSLKSLLKFPDLIEPITEVNREVRMVESILLEGDAYEYRRVLNDGVADWDLTSIASPDAALLAAHDLAYQADLKKREFVFTARDAELEFLLPTWLRESPVLFRVDAQGTHDVDHHLTERGTVVIRDKIDVVGLYVVTCDRELRPRLAARQARLLAKEASIEFDPGKNAEDLEQLGRLLGN